MEKKSSKRYSSRPDASSQAENPTKSSPKVEEKEIVLNKEESRSWRDHSNPFVRFLAKTGFTVWLIVMAVGVGLAFLVAFIAV
ncbi:MAG: hypothetical protein WBG71_02975 [Leeuwenhoekiella sp.]